MKDSLEGRLQAMQNFNPETGNHQPFGFPRYIDCNFATARFKGDAYSEELNRGSSKALWALPKGVRRKALWALREAVRRKEGKLLVVLGGKRVMILCGVKRPLKSIKLNVLVILHTNFLHHST